MDDERIDLLIFGIGNKDLAETDIVIKRKETKDIQMISYGKTTYQYGETFDVSGYQLFVQYEHGENEYVNLSPEMLDLPSLILTPEHLGLNEIDVYYNGFKMSYSIPIFVEKATQTLQESLVKLDYFNLFEIAVKPIEGAEYAFFKAGDEPQSINWQDEPVFELIEAEVDYTVLVRMKETPYKEASNIVEKTFEYQPLIKQPNPLFQVQTELSLN